MRNLIRIGEIKMSIEVSVLLFDKNNVTEEQIKTHVLHYVGLAEKGLKMIQVDKAAAMTCLKEIRSTMKEEYKYYSRSKIQGLISGNHLYNTYYAFIQDAFVKQSNPNSYDKLSSNLYDVMDYGRHYFRNYLKEDTE